MKLALFFFVTYFFVTVLHRKIFFTHSPTHGYFDVLIVSPSFLAGITNRGYQVFETHISGLARGLSTSTQNQIRLDPKLASFPPQTTWPARPLQGA